ncbi:MAG: cell division protein ZapA [Thermoanaerobaculia bacterium]
MSETVPSSTTEVQIFGATYLIRGGHDGGNLADLAAQVDRRMRELAGHAVTADSGKLAILVALNLADELSRREQEATGERNEIETRVTELTERLGELLKG